MTFLEMLEILKVFLTKITADMIFPVALQKGDRENEARRPAVYKMRLPNGKRAEKFAPYILIQLVNGINQQPQGRDSENSENSFFVRFVFVVYNENEEEGSAMLLNLMDRVRIKLLEQVVVGNRIILDTDKGLEYIIYPDDTAPYYAGEIVGTFYGSPIERKISYE
ncbi:MAG: hypothetical protein ACI4F5_06500 [Acutalibacteraceae bacterium]